MEIILNNKFELNKNWKFSLVKSRGISEKLKDKTFISDEFYPATIPGTIHTDILNNKLIDDPYYSDNELNMNWISECDWVYQTEFDFNADSNENVDLIFEGLDTISEIYLNNKKLGETDNMFLKFQYNVKDILKSKNKLKVIIKSPVKYALDQENKYGRIPVALNSSRVYIRKAQYSFGWDWGPSFPTSGIWRKVYLQEWHDAKVADIIFKTNEINKKSAEVEVEVNVKSQKSRDLFLKVSISDIDSYKEKIVKITSANKYKINFKIDNPKLWWPNGEGEQNLYTVNIKIIHNNIIIDDYQKRVGIRTIKLITSENGKATFKFRLNNKDIYCKGVNWIPADSFLPRVTQTKYSKLLSLAKDANINIVRVWGGGIYESDEFYNLCDQLGFLVWQDFMFACGSYPEHPDFIANVKEEILQNVFRIQHHACLTVWCGNNENEWIWYQDQKSSYKNMPGYKIYHKIIPDLLKDIDTGQPYWPSSPFGNEEDPNSFDSGNNHQWNIWSRWIDYENVKQDKSLFVTEFGFQGPADKSTLEKYIPKESRFITSEIFEHHNKQVEGPERIIKFLSNHLPIKTEWNDYLYLTQLNQGLALKSCLEHWRTNGRTNGSIIWQINDSWPVVSWSIIDYEIRPKLAYYFVKNSFSQQMIYFVNDENKIRIFLLNQNKAIIKGKLRITVIDGKSGNIFKDTFIKVDINKKANPHLTTVAYEDLSAKGNWVLTTVLYDESNKVICRNYFLVKHWKHISLSKTKLDFEIVNRKNEYYLSLKSDNAIFFVYIYHSNLTLSDQGFFILPGEVIEVKIIEKEIKQINKQDFKIYYLNNYLHP